MEFQFGFFLFSARDIAKESVSVEHAILFMNGCGPVLYPDPGSVLAPEAIFDLETALLAE